VEIPAATLRLFPHHAPEDLDPARGQSLLIARLLEDGDSSDLTWLHRLLPEAAVADWLEGQGGRQLSVRSRAFWEVVLGRRAGGATPEATARKELWPL
jgi:hypothetical protein